MAEALWVEEKITGGWFAQARMVVQGGRMVVAELRLSAISKTPPGGITQEVVRRVSLGSFGPYVLAAKSFVDTGRAGRSIPPRPRPRRASGRDDLFYARLARDYVAAIKDGSRSPVKDLAERRNEPLSRLRDMVHQARERGLLSCGGAGVRGGELLPRAKILLRRPGR